MGILDSAQRIFKYKDGVYIKGYMQIPTEIQKIIEGEDYFLLYTEPDCPLKEGDVISENGSEYLVKDCMFGGRYIKINTYYLVPYMRQKAVNDNQP